MTQMDNYLVIEPMGKFQAFALKWFGKLVGLRGNPYLVFIENKDIKQKYEMSISDLAKQMAEDEMNSVREKPTNRMESGE